MTLPVLGRPVYLGSLYDAKRSEILSADSLWSQETIKKKKAPPTKSYSSNTYVFAAQSQFDRMNHMDIDVHLKLEFLGMYFPFTNILVGPPGKINLKPQGQFDTKEKEGGLCEAGIKIELRIQYSNIVW